MGQHLSNTIAIIGSEAFFVNEVTFIFQYFTYFLQFMRSLPALYNEAIFLYNFKICR